MTKQNSNEILIRTTESQYAPRIPLLKDLARNLEEETRVALGSIPRVDRVSFRVKAPDKFAHKSVAIDEDGSPKYKFPLADIEDQVGGRVLVLFRRDIDTVVGRLLETFNRAEQTRKAPKDFKAFGYESDHLVLIIPPHVCPTDWNALEFRPTTFEMQVRTLFMHAWAEPEHDISYKAKVPLTDEERRKIAWAAANAWGGDAIFEQVLDSLAARSPSRGGSKE